MDEPDKHDLQRRDQVPVKEGLTMRRNVARRTLIVLSLVVAALLIPAGGVRPAHAACSLGDIICEGQQAIQQLIDSYIGPLKDWATFQANKAFYQVVYNVEKSVASAQWSLSKALTTVGVGIGVITDWLSTNFFQPMISTSNDTFRPITGMIFFIALMVLGCTYVLAAVIRLNIVHPRNMLLWYVTGLLFFQIGPGFYASMNTFRQTVATFFYASSINAVKAQSPFQQLASGDDAKNSAIYGMSQPCNNFPSFIKSPPGTVSGVDIALAYQKADGFDVVSDGAKGLGGGKVEALPRVWFNANGYFDLDKAPDTWVMPVAPATVDDVVGNMLAAVLQAFGGISRLFNAIPLVGFGVVEQLVSLCLMLAQGLTFISFGCAILFAFFRRTEPIAWAVLDQWIALIVQTVVIAIVQALVIALYMSAAATASPLITLAVSVVGLVLMGILLISGIRAVWGAFNRLFEAFGQATSGAVISTGQASQAAIGAAATAASLAVTGGASALGGISALNSGATWAQAAGVAFGGSRALDGAAFSLARLPGLRETALGEAASQYIEGSATRRVGDSLLGPFGGAVIGPALLTDRNPNHDEAYLGDNGKPYWQPAMLNHRVEPGMATLLSGPTWERGEISAIGRGGTILHGDDDAPLRRGDMREGMPPGDPASGTFMPAIPRTLSLNNDGNLDETINEDFKRDLAAYGSAQTSSTNQAAANQRLELAAGKLEGSASLAGDALSRAAHELGRSVQAADTQKRLEQVEGRMQVSGAQNVAEVMASTVDIIRKQNALDGSVGADSKTVAHAMAQSMGITPVERDGKTVAPIERNIARFQMFADQALQMGLDSGSTSRFIREIKNNPDGQLSAATRDKIVTHLHESRGHSWQDSLGQVQRLEHTIRMLPDDITAYGAKAVPAGSDAHPVVLTPATGSPTVFTPVQPSPTPPHQPEGK